MKRKGNQTRVEMNVAKRKWGPLGRERIKELQSLVERHKSDTPRGAGGLVSGAASKAVVPLVEASR